MALKKSELYSSLKNSCDELRGGMDASQYKDYVLVLLFIKYISDKYAGLPYAPITIPDGSSFKDMVALKGKPDIGDQINKKIIDPLANANKLSDFPDFNDTAKLGDGKEKVERLTNLIAIFENPALDFSKNRAGGDDLIGDAYEYLMRHFATESGKSKGQFYTPAEVSRVIAQIIGIREAKTTNATTVYDPTCGSGSLLIKVGDEAGTPVTLYGQERDAATSGLARMNMILHNHPTALIAQGNTLAAPKFKDGETLKTFDYVIANPPFSDKGWSTGIDPLHDLYERFLPFGTPPTRQGDYAYLLHIVRSLRNTGKGACILPHGAMTRPNAEADIRRALVRRGYIIGIIGLPFNLFYGTGIPACIVVIDKNDSQTRKGIFMIDASAGFVKDGPKNRLRAQDIHKIIDVFNKRHEIPKYSRMVSYEEIEKKEFTLTLSRYIDNQEAKDFQDIVGHLHGGIPIKDVDALQSYWTVFPTLQGALFKESRAGYLNLGVAKTDIKSTIYDHPEFAAFIASMNVHFLSWRRKNAEVLRQLKIGCHPKEIITSLSEDLLANYTNKPLFDQYDIYQHLMDYWEATLQDDCYLIAENGWKAETYRIIEEDKKGKEKDRGWTCDLVPKAIIVGRFFAKEEVPIIQLKAKLENVTARMTELEEENGGEEGAFFEIERVSKTYVITRLKEIKSDLEAKDEAATLNDWLKLASEQAYVKRCLKEAETKLDTMVYAKYPQLTESEVQSLVVDDKWLTTLESTIQDQMERISRALTQRVQELGERYEVPLPRIDSHLVSITEKVKNHFEKMGFSLKECSMQDLLTGKKRLPGFSGEWEPVQLRDLLSYERPDQYIVGDTNYIEWGEIPVLTANKTFILGYTVENFGICRNLPVIIFDDFTTDSKYVNFPFKVKSSAIKILRTKHNMVDLRFVFGLIQLINFPIGDHKRYYISEYQKLKLMVPKYKEQLAISNVLFDLDTEIVSLEARLTKTRLLKLGIMQELLDGGFGSDELHR